MRSASESGASVTQKKRPTMLTTLKKIIGVIRKTRAKRAHAFIINISIIRYDLLQTNRQIVVAVSLFPDLFARILKPQYLVGLLQQIKPS